jgi:hypothetical protein
MKVLRIFFTIHELADRSSNRYSKRKESRDFPADMAIEAAHSALYKEFGALDLSKANAPTKYCVIHSHTVLENEREKVVLANEKAVEQPLFDPITLKECLMDSPRMAAKRKNRGPF